MKKTVLNLAMALFIGFSATATEPIADEKKEVNTETSTIAWKGHKLGGGHSGSLALQSGSLMFDGDKLTGGEFVVDMTTLAVTDLEAGKGKEKLEGHLNKDDFFGTEKHATAKLVFTNVKSSGENSYDVTGDLTIKGISKPVTFSITVYAGKATATLKVDRTKYGITFGSSSFTDTLKDKAIYDEFDLVADLKF